MFGATIVGGISYWTAPQWGVDPRMKLGGRNLVLVTPHLLHENPWEAADGRQQGRLEKGPTYGLTVAQTRELSRSLLRAADALERLEREQAQSP